MQFWVLDDVGLGPDHDRWWSLSLPKHVSYNAAMICEEAIAKLKAPYLALQREFPLCFLALFGSVAHGETCLSRICAVSLDLSHQERRET